MSYSVNNGVKTKKSIFKSLVTAQLVYKAYVFI